MSKSISPAGSGPLATVWLGDHHQAQGRLVRPPVGDTGTVDAGGQLVTGRLLPGGSAPLRLEMIGMDWSRGFGPAGVDDADPPGPAPRVVACHKSAGVGPAEILEKRQAEIAARLDVLEQRQTALADEFEEFRAPWHDGGGSK